MDGKSPDTILVTFVVQLGTALFLGYINDLPDYLTYSKLSMFVDNSIIYRSQSDCDKLQVDLDVAAKWENDWLTVCN